MLGMTVVVQALVMTQQAERGHPELREEEMLEATGAGQSSVVVWSAELRITSLRGLGGISHLALCPAILHRSFFIPLPPPPKSFFTHSPIWRHNSHRHSENKMM